MPKLKTHKGTAKRIKLTGSGKLARERAYGNHILAKKSKARKRNIRLLAPQGRCCQPIYQSPRAAVRTHARDRRGAAARRSLFHRMS